MASQDQPIVSEKRAVRYIWFGVAMFFVGLFVFRGFLVA
jgi:hypothetical protein